MDGGVIDPVIPIMGMITGLIITLVVMIGLPWLILHHIVAWRRSGQLSTDDEHMLEDVWRAARAMEHRIDALESIGIPARRIPGWTGVFVDRERSQQVPTDAASGRERKIASIGVGVRRWVTFHGFALNVTIDLEGFRSIVPCGLHDVEMTSVERELGAGAGTEAGMSAASRDDIDAHVRRVVSRQMRIHLASTGADAAN